MNGSTFAYLQLACNERHPDTRKPVARIIQKAKSVLTG
jgi:hypothetical protein